MKVNLVGLIRWASLELYGKKTRYYGYSIAEMGKNLAVAVDEARVKGELDSLPASLKAFVEGYTLDEPTTTESLINDFETNWT